MSLGLDRPGIYKLEIKNLRCSFYGNDKLTRNPQSLESTFRTIMNLNLKYACGTYEDLKIITRISLSV